MVGSVIDRLVDMAKRAWRRTRPPNAPIDSVPRPFVNALLHWDAALAAKRFETVVSRTQTKPRHWNFGHGSLNSRTDRGLMVVELELGQGIRFRRDGVVIPAAIWNGIPEIVRQAVSGKALQDVIGHPACEGLTAGEVQPSAMHERYDIGGFRTGPSASPVIKVRDMWISVEQARTMIEERLRPHDS